LKQPVSFRYPQGNPPHGEQGEIILHAESSKWLSDNLGDLRKLPEGRYMDKECKRTFPAGPKPYFH